MMSYCRNKWISDDLWRLWRDRVRTRPSSRARLGDLLALSGAVGDGDGTLTGSV
ncbi:hypothetical protein V2I01_32185 [Micromonospora sp. BRA006-A]|nr:hypothetical protein [Micromonospora sp. BRA006-A]